MAVDEKQAYLPWDRFHSWVHCVCVVTFDIEIGQAIELIYPPHATLTEKEKLNICYLSFPDSNSGCTGDTAYQCRVRRCNPSLPSHPSLLPFIQDAPTALQIDNSYYQGYVYFRQTKDQRLKRGYFQKSLVLLSHLPLHNLFTTLLTTLAPHFFDLGLPSLEAACHNIDQWPSPTPGSFLNLPIAGSIIQIRIPSRSDKLLNHNHHSKVQPQTNEVASVFLPSVYEVDIYSNLLPIITQAQVLWELVLTCEPIVVMANQPSMCSSVVQSLTQMILPLKYASDFHPFFTIHDSDFKEFTAKHCPPPATIIGVTNLFFVKALKHWPHIININCPNQDVMTRSIGPLRNSNKSLDNRPGLQSKYEGCLKRDKGFWRKLMRGLRRPVEVQNAMLKRHLLELTQSFMIPLERYISTLMPLAKCINANFNTPKLPEFDSQQFFKSLSSNGPQLTSTLKGNWVALYRRFIKCANFDHWWKLRREEMNRKLILLHIQAISNHDLKTWLEDKGEVHIVDMIIRVKEKMKWLETQRASSSGGFKAEVNCNPSSSSSPRRSPSPPSLSSAIPPPSSSLSSYTLSSSSPQYLSLSSYADEGVDLDSSSLSPSFKSSSSRPSSSLSSRLFKSKKPLPSSSSQPHSLSSSLSPSSSSSKPPPTSSSPCDYDSLHAKLHECFKTLVSHLPTDLQAVFNHLDY